MFVYKENLSVNIIFSFAFDSLKFLLFFENRILFREITKYRFNQTSIDSFEILSVKYITVIETDGILIDILILQKKIYIILL